MKKIILSITAMFLFCSVALADGISFTEKKTWKELIALAKKENKLIFLDAYATWCGPCNYLQKDVFTQQAVGDYFNKTYINARIDMEAGEGPAIAEEFGVTAYPTLFFVNGDGKVVHKYVGALAADELLDLGKEANDPEKQYYTIKARAEAGELTPKAFHAWIHSAEKMEDEEVTDVIKAYLEKVDYPLIEKEMLDIIFEHSGLLPADLLDKLVAKKTEIMKLKEYDEDDFSRVITAKAVSLALEESIDDDVIDFEVFKNIVAKYSPAKATLETQIMRVKYHFYKDEDKEGLDELAKLITGNTFNLPPASLASIIVERAKKIVDAKRNTEFINKIKGFKLNADDSKQGYYKDFALLAIYFRMADKAKTAELIKKINTNEDAPEKLKELTAEFEVE